MVLSMISKSWKKALNKHAGNRHPTTFVRWLPRAWRIFLLSHQKSLLLGQWTTWDKHVRRDISQLCILWTAFVWMGNEKAQYNWLSQCATALWQVPRSGYQHGPDITAKIVHLSGEVIFQAPIILYWWMRYPIRLFRVSVLKNIGQEGCKLMNGELEEVRLPKTLKYLLYQWTKMKIRMTLHSQF